MRTFLITACLGLASLGFVAAGRADAHEPGGFYRGHYGTRFHDVMPHWHTTYSPFGPVNWYGTGRHDFLPHAHRVTPWGELRGYSMTPFGPTISHYRSPYYRGYYGYRDGCYRGW